MNLDHLPYSIDPMMCHDIPTITSLERDVFSLPWSSTAFRYELKHNSASEYLILRYAPWMDRGPSAPALESVRRLLQPHRTDPSVIGYGGYWMILGEAHICTLAVRPEWRGHGLGELLLAALISNGLANDAREVTLEVRESNSVAQNLYAKYGFEVVGRRKRYYSDNNEDARIMTVQAAHSPIYHERFRHLQQELLARLRADTDVPPALEQSPSGG